MKLITQLTTFAAGALFATSVAAETKVKMADLPAAVQAAVKAQTTNATLVGISKEEANGQTVYEVETKVGTKTRDLLLDMGGKVVEVEEEVNLADVPAAVKPAIEKNASGGTIKKVEKVTKGSDVVYEVALQKNGKKSEFVVNADGTLHVDAAK